MTNSDQHLRLAGVTRLDVEGERGLLHAYVFDPHRLAFPVWALEVADGKPALLVTFDRHLDLVPPSVEVPDRSVGLRALDEFARYSLDVRNYDHILAAMECNLISDALVIARSSPKGAIAPGAFIDQKGVSHQIIVAPTLDQLLAGPDGEHARGLFDDAESVLLDFDVDCFTTLSDADPTTVIPWPKSLIREHLVPRGSKPFWDALLKKCRAVTIAREAPHCGGLIAESALFADFAQILFVELLGADLP